MRLRNRHRVKDTTRYWTSEESEAFARVREVNVSERGPEMEGRASVVANVVLTCAGCGRVIERGEALIARWDGWADGEPVPEWPERVWHDFECLAADHGGASTGDVASQQPISLASKREALEGRLRHRGA